MRTDISTCTSYTDYIALMSFHKSKKITQLVADHACINLLEFCNKCQRLRRKLFLKFDHGLSSGTFRLALYELKTSELLSISPKTKLA